MIFKNPFVRAACKNKNLIFMNKKNVTFKFHLVENSADSSRNKKYTLENNGKEKLTVPAPNYYSTISDLDIKVNYYRTITNMPFFE